jgi:hypothetical protein
MKHTLASGLAALGLAAGLAALMGCGIVGGTVTTPVAARDFTAVNTGAGITVEIVSSPDWAVELIADRQAVGRIIVEARGGTLWIGLRAGTFARARWLASQARVAIAMPSLDRLDAAGGSLARLGVEQPDRDLVVSLTAGSSLTGSLACAALALSARGAGVADIRGTARSVKLEASDGSKLRLSGFETPSMDASLSGGSTAAVAVSERLVVVADGGSGLSFRGDARVESQTLSGGSWLRKE